MEAPIAPLSPSCPCWSRARCRSRDTRPRGQGQTADLVAVAVVFVGVGGDGADGDVVLADAAVAEVIRLAGGDDACLAVEVQRDAGVVGDGDPALGQHLEHVLAALLQHQLPQLLLGHDVLFGLLVGVLHIGLEHLVHLVLRQAVSVILVHLIIITVFGYVIIAITVLYLVQDIKVLEVGPRSVLHLHVVSVVLLTDVRLRGPGGRLLRPGLGCGGRLLARGGAGLGLAAAGLHAQPQPLRLLLGFVVFDAQLLAPLAVPVTLGGTALGLDMGGLGRGRGRLLPRSWRGRQQRVCLKFTCRICGRLGVMGIG